MWRKTKNDKAAESQQISIPNDSLDSTVFHSIRNEHDSIVNEKSITGRTIVIKGDISAEEDLQIKGCVEGTIHLQKNNLRVGKSGQIKANVYTKTINVDGKVEGDIYASEQVIIHKTGQVYGNIVTPRFIVEEGALIKGAIDMDPKTLEKHFPRKEIESLPHKIENSIPINMSAVKKPHNNFNELAASSPHLPPFSAKEQLKENKDKDKNKEEKHQKN